MATETAPVNGLYGTNQYAQPAELAASTPAAPSHAPSASQSTSTSATAQQQKADPQEIGWYFVEQYYTTLSKTPEKIHLFYSKKSQLVSGVEAEKVVPALGTKAISEKIKSLDFSDCKVRVLNVDSQASFSNIVVQVIGEMSNKSEPHHKFVQTFVLAEQPNGYFVLNDIFRYLSDDEDEIVEDEPAPAETPVEQAPTPADGLTDHQPHLEDQVVTEDTATEVDEKLQEEQTGELQEESADVNGDDGPATTEEPLESPEAPSTEEAFEEESTELAPPEQPAEPESSSPDAEPVHEAAAPAPAAAADAPPTKKTWASMVGGGVQKPAIPALPITTPAPTKAARPAQSTQASKTATEPASATTPTSASTPISQSNGWQTAEHSKKSNRSQNRVISEGTTLAYIKNVNDKVDARILREVLETFGELKYFDVSRPRSCAFVEFADATGYAAAVAANPHTVGSETIIVEERRPRPNAYGGANANYGRGGGAANTSNSTNNNNTRGGRGGAQGSSRSGSQTNFPKDAGRGGTFQQRGGKLGTGTVTPKGRGQGQAV